tara:strand:- start:199 stop:759 length:561 start_codon:yes stop_codon:yes gene_type:complete
MKKIFIDAGANIGISIKLFLEKYPNSNEFEIHSFEANPNLFSKLDAYSTQATIYHKAVYIEDTTLDFYLGADLGSSLRKDKTTGGININNKIQVEAINLAQFIKDNFNKKDYIILKLDVEGAEYDILPHFITEGMFDGWINELFGEWHEGKLKEVSIKQQQDLDKLLFNKGFRMKDWCAEKEIIEL